MPKIPENQKKRGMILNDSQKIPLKEEVYLHSMRTLGIKLHF
jgi:hypothetical protein